MIQWFFRLIGRDCGCHRRKIQLYNFLAVRSYAVGQWWTAKGDDYTHKVIMLDRTKG